MFFSFSVKGWIERRKRGAHVGFRPNACAGPQEGGARARGRRGAPSSSDIYASASSGRAGGGGCGGGGGDGVITVDISEKTTTFAADDGHDVAAEGEDEGGRMMPAIMCVWGVYSCRA